MDDPWQRYLNKGNELADKAAAASRKAGFAETTHQLKLAQADFNNLWSAPRLPLRNWSKPKLKQQWWQETKGKRRR